MNYADTLRVMLEGYPSIFVNEADALHHLFFVNGNGYEWVDGELTDGEYGTPGEQIELILDRRLSALRAILAKNPDFGFIKEQVSLYEAGVDAVRGYEMANRAESIRFGSSCWFFLPDGRVGRKLYPICEHAKIFSIPEDVRPDWYAAAEEALVLAKSDLFSRTPRDDERLAIAAIVLLVSDPHVYL